MTDSETRIAPGGVVAGVDGSPNASLAAAWAANEALLREESLTLVHALSMPDVNAVPSPPHTRYEPGNTDVTCLIAPPKPSASDFPICPSTRCSATRRPGQHCTS